MRLKPQVVFLGTLGDLSPAPLAALIEAGIAVRAVITPRRGPPAEPVRRARCPGAQSQLPVLGGPAQTIAGIAWDHCIPVLEVARLRHPEAVSAIAAFCPDFLCVACFPQLLPPELLAVPRCGSLNVHPSLLPAHRGPAPLFWTFRHGDSRSGVTVHWMDAGIDTGDIALQEEISLPDGISSPELQRQCAERGGQLLVEVVRAVAAGCPPRRAQPPGGCYEFWPRAEDFVVPTSRPARWAFNFIRGASAWGQPVVDAAGNRFPVCEAVEYNDDERLPASLQRAGDDLLVQCSPGTLRVKTAAPTE